MSHITFNTFKSILGLGLLCLLAACGRPSHPMGSPAFKTYKESKPSGISITKYQKKVTPHNSSNSIASLPQQDLWSYSPIDFLPTIVPSIESKSDKVLLPRGTRMVAIVKENINSDEVYTGQTIFLENYKDVVVEGKTVIERGARIRANVQSVKSKRTMGRAGEIELALKSVETVDGQIIPLESTIMYEEGKHKKWSAWGWAIGCILVFGIFLIGVLGLLFLLTKGRSAQILIGKSQETATAFDVEIEVP